MDTGPAQTPQSPSSVAFRHFAFGAVIESTIELPQLISASTDQPADISIILDKVSPDDIISPQLRRRTITGLLRYECRDGVHAVIEPAPGADLANVADMIAGWILTILSYQRGILPLHAAGVRVGAGIVAIAGPSGIGKSTLAAALVAQRLQLVADDMVAVRRGDPMQASGGARRLKLSPASLDGLGWPDEGWPLANNVEGKRLVAPPTTGSNCNGWLPLRAIFRLSAGDNDSLCPLTPIEAAAGAWNVIRAPQLIDVCGDRSEHWASWLALCRDTPMISLIARRDIADTPRLVDMVLSFLDRET